MKKLFLFLVITLGLNGELVETFYKTGELKERYNLKNGIRDGIYTKWYLNGQIGRQANYKAGIMDGELKTWYPNGVVKATYPIISGKIEGTAKNSGEASKSGAPEKKNTSSAATEKK